MGHDIPKLTPRQKELINLIAAFNWQVMDFKDPLIGYTLHIPIKDNKDSDIETAKILLRELFDNASFSVLKNVDFYEGMACRFHKGNPKREDIPYLTIYHGHKWLINAIETQRPN